MHSDLGRSSVQHSWMAIGGVSKVHHFKDPTCRLYLRCCGSLLFLSSHSHMWSFFSGWQWFWGHLMEIARKSSILYLKSGQHTSSTHSTHFSWTLWPFVPTTFSVAKPQPGSFLPNPNPQVVNLPFPPSTLRVKGQAPKKALHATTFTSNSECSALERMDLNTWATAEAPKKNGVPHEVYEIVVV